MSALRGPRDMPGMEGYLKGCRRVLRRARAARVSACVVRARQCVCVSPAIRPLSPPGDMCEPLASVCVCAAAQIE